MPTAHVDCALISKADSLLHKILKECSLLQAKQPASISDVGLRTRFFEELGGPRFNLILISTVSPRSCMSSNDLTGLIPIQFAAYQPKQLCQLLRAMRPQNLDAAHYENLLQCVPALTKVSNRLHDLKAMIERLWPEYVALCNAAPGDQGLAGFYERFIKASSKTRGGFTEEYSQLQQAWSRRAELRAEMTALGDTEQLLLLAAYLASKSDEKRDAMTFPLGPGSSRPSEAAMLRFRAKGQLPFTKSRLRFWFDQVKGISSHGEVPLQIQAVRFEDCIRSNIEKGLLSQCKTADRLTCNILDDDAEELALYWPELVLKYYMQ